jgi:hypothetical protein
LGGQKYNFPFLSFPRRRGSMLSRKPMDSRLREKGYKAMGYQIGLLNMQTCIDNPEK